jgi:hypothetical protein
MVHGVCSYTTSNARIYLQHWEKNCLRVRREELRKGYGENVSIALYKQNRKHLVQIEAMYLS